MTYLMVVRVPADVNPTREEGDPSAWVEASEGQRLFGDRLRPPQDATCVRVRDGRTLVTYGPFVEITEQIAGFDLLSVDDADAAIQLALTHPVAKFGALELRELHPFELPDGTVDDVPYLREPVTYALLMGTEPDAPEPGAGDDRLRLVFACCHPALPLEGRVALTLRTLGGLEVAEVAAAFGVSEAAMAKRLVRARQKIAHARIPYRVPSSAELPERLEAVLGVLYLVFTEGYARPSRTAPRRT